jgi:hypothetical protein
MNNFDNLKNILNEDETPDSKAFRKKVDNAAKSLGKLKITFKVTEVGTASNRYLKVAAYVKNTEIGAIWVQNHGGTIGLDFTDASGLFEIDEFNDHLRNLIGGR